MGGRDLCHSPHIHYRSLISMAFSTVASSKGYRLANAAFCVCSGGLIQLVGGGWLAGAGG